MPKQILNLGRNWYAVHTYSGYEDAVARNLRKRIETLNMQDKIFDVLVPTIKKIKIQAGKRKIIEEKVYPGYVFVDMIVTDDSWYVVRNTPRVTGFVGAGNIPIPIDQDQMSKISKFIKESREPKYKMDLIVGDQVRIIDGPFKDYEGKINETNEEKGRVKVLISLFGRETPVELDYLQVKKL